MHKSMDISKFSYRKLGKDGSTSSTRQSELDDQTSVVIVSALALKSYTIEELKIATKKFHIDRMLGEGGSGTVYKGWIDEQTFAVTKPGRGIAVSVKELKQSLTEVKILGQFYHPNLVRVLGYCLDKGQCFVVSEFMSGGSLDNYIFRRNYGALLSWSIRMNIALGAAKGLAFLHSATIDCLHWNVSSSNILLDANYSAKLSDFGYNWIKNNETENIWGRPIRGYDAPEYVATGRYTAKCDIFSFGVVLLEILFGRRGVEVSVPPENRCLVKWSKPYLSCMGKLSVVLDMQYNGQYSRGGAYKLADLVLRCTVASPRMRPDMNEVVKALEEL